MIASLLILSFIALETPNPRILRRALAILCKALRKGDFDKIIREIIVQMFDEVCLPAGRMRVFKTRVAESLAVPKCRVEKGPGDR